MDYNATRTFTLTLAHRAVGDIRRGGFRQLRNYVDMCATLCKKPQQRDFFAYAQKSLQHTDSCYYTLIHNLLDTVDEDCLCTVGVNFALGGLIYSASEQKKKADVDGQAFSWLNVARSDDPNLPTLVANAEKKNSFVWVLDATQADPAQIAALVNSHNKCAFGILAEPSTITTECADTLSQCSNIVVLPLLQSPELTPEACRAARNLRQHKMMYMLTVLLDEHDAQDALQEDWLESVAQETQFCLYARRADVTEKTGENLYRDIVLSRKETGNPVLLLDWDKDIAYLNHRLSEHAVIGNALPQGTTFPLIVDNN